PIKVERTVLWRIKRANMLKGFFYSPQHRTLYLNRGFSSAQENFLIGRELGFQCMGIEERPNATRIVRQDSFEKLFNNFKASYFSVALLMDEHELVKDIKRLAQQSTWQPDALLSLLSKYDVTPEMLLQRMSNILPKHMGIKDLFFLRLNGASDLKSYYMTKELHLSQHHNPHGNVRDEHYCRRWISINIIKQLRASRRKEPIAAAQISQYWETTNEYLCLAISKPNDDDAKASVSVTIGLLITPQVREYFGFLNDPNLKVKQVNTTCERCSMPDCGARAMSPVILEEQDEHQRVLAGLEELGTP
ncbi:MAG: ImmA/IrrE family metallo-endopeptidase, partial [Bacteroidota bacterium]